MVLALLRGRYTAEELLAGGAEHVRQVGAVLLGRAACLACHPFQHPVEVPDEALQRLRIGLLWLSTGDDVNRRGLREDALRRRPLRQELPAATARRQPARCRDWKRLLDDGARRLARRCR